MELPQGFLGSFYGPTQGHPENYVVVTKWSSKDVIGNHSWLRHSEERLSSTLDGKGHIEHRRQMYI